MTQREIPPTSFTLHHRYHLSESRLELLVNALIINVIQPNLEVALNKHKPTDFNVELVLT